MFYGNFEFCDMQVPILSVKVPTKVFNLKGPRGERFSPIKRF